MGYKLKKHSGASKRFKKTGTGKLVHARAGNSHLATRKSSNRKRRLRKSTTISSAMSSRNKKMIN